MSHVLPGLSFWVRTSSYSFHFSPLTNLTDPVLVLQVLPDGSWQSFGPLSVWGQDRRDLVSLQEAKAQTVIWQWGTCLKEDCWRGARPAVVEPWYMHDVKHTNTRLGTTAMWCPGCRTLPLLCVPDDLKCPGSISSVVTVLQPYLKLLLW